MVLQIVEGKKRPKLTNSEISKMKMRKNTFNKSNLKELPKSQISQKI